MKIEEYKEISEEVRIILIKLKEIPIYQDLGIAANLQIAINQVYFNKIKKIIECN